MGTLYLHMAFIFMRNIPVRSQRVYHCNSLWEALNSLKPCTGKSDNVSWPTRQISGWKWLPRGAVAILGISQMDEN